MPHPTQVASALADPERLELYARVIVAGAAGVPAEEVMAAGPIAARHPARSASSGLVREEEGRMTWVPDVFATALRDQRPDRPGDPVDELFRDGRLAAMPTRRALRLGVLDRIARTLFAPGTEYDEKQVDTALRSCFDDHSALRRYLVDEGCPERSADGGVCRSTAR
ncbi:DUF2087 domain-containing protein [Nocardiopsis sp. N85]|uniref:DUF2087 domain-containing protein n=1 Tax=Nocardiopsis sp. N85 TaxID=3029400 RepID=UPI00237FBDB8|nr:DUF2087 domain-containing protein [Nocardiopsis sp. N85]MDE3720689.1 DUF2087 domain-containing protein [Nocardiopsis sp. N85]